MDEEDIAEAEEARELQTAEAFAGLGPAVDHTSRGNSVMEIFRTSGETMGVKLLKKMGWREGQGVGPKVRRRARVDEDQNSLGETGEDAHLFAPENSKMISFIKKSDRKGLGFEGEGRLEENNLGTNGIELQDADIKGDGKASSGTFTGGIPAKNKKLERNGGFGVGVLNDNGSDDEDPYAIGPQISYNRVVGGNKKKKRKPETGRPSANPLLNTKPVFISKKTSAIKVASNLRRSHDGRLPLEGFTLSNTLDPQSSILSQDGKYPPPTIPQDWISSKKQNHSGTSASKDGEYQSSAAVAAASKLSPKSRAAALGEKPLPGKSVFDFLTATARNRIVSATNNDQLPPALGEASIQLSSQPKSLKSLVPPLAREIAQTALGRGTAGWMPYAEDLSKRARYRAFLEVHAGVRPEGTLPDRNPDHNNDDWVNEMNEFAHAAQIFKPMTGTMATRFTSSSSAPQLASDKVERETTIDPAGDTSLLTKPNGKAKTPAEEAAAVGMYGPLTRSVDNFYPTRLLCKRFNVQPPAHVQVDRGDPSSGFATAPPTDDTSLPQTHSTALPRKSLELVGKKDMENLRITGGGMQNPAVEPEINAANNLGKEVASNSGEEQITVVDPERNEALEKERPGEAVFKAIFGSDSEDD